jgi:hypothetical protein
MVSSKGRTIQFTAEQFKKAVLKGKFKQQEAKCPRTGFTRGEFVAKIRTTYGVIPPADPAEDSPCITFDTSTFYILPKIYTGSGPFTLSCWPRISVVIDLSLPLDPQLKRIKTYGEALRVSKERPSDTPLS